MSPILGYLISFILSPFLFLLIAICYIYRCCIEWILSKRFCDEFAGLATGMDARMCRNFPNENIVNCLLLVDFKTSDSQKVKQIFEDNLKPIFESGLFPKITCALLNEYGYNCFVQKEYNWDQAVTIIYFGRDSDLLELSHVQNYLSQLSNRKMTKKANALIEFLISNKPIGNSQTFAVIFRFHHALGDGPSILHFMTYVFKSDTLTKEQNVMFDKSTPTPSSKLSKIFDILSTVFYLTFGSFAVFKGDLLKEKEVNMFHGEKTSGEKIAQWIDEDKENLIPKIKEIQKKTGGSFTEILLTCIVASLHQFAKKRITRFDNITIIHPIQTTKINLLEIPKLYHSFSINIMNFRVDSQLKQLLKNIMETDQNTKNSILIPATDACIRVFSTVFPTFFNDLLAIKNVTMILSNMGYMGKMKVFGYDLKYLYIFPANIDLINLAFGVNSYENRLHLAATIDKEYIDNVEDLTEILQGSSNNIEKLYKEIS